MALVRISDVVVPEVYQSYTAENSPEKTAFWQSGVIARNANFDSRAEGPSNITTMPFWKDLDASVAPNLSNDDPTDVAVPNKIGTSEMKARTAYLNQSYSDADIVVELNGSDPMQRIRNRFGTYWMRQWQRRLLSAVAGIMWDNVDNDDSDMVHSSGNVYSRASFTSAIFTLGDAFGEISAMAVHSSVMKQMVDQEDIDYIVPSEGSIPVATYLGKRVIVDDSMPAATTTAALGTLVFTSVFFGSSAFGYGEGTPSVPTYVKREELQGNGGGVEIIGERKTWLLHPFGFDFTSASVAGQSATNVELATAANWDRKVDRKNVPMAFLTSTLTVPT